MLTTVHMSAALQAPHAPTTFSFPTPSSYQSSVRIAWCSIRRPAALSSAPGCLSASLKDGVSRSGGVEERVRDSEGGRCGCVVCGRRKLLSMAGGALYGRIASPTRAVGNDDPNYLDTLLLQDIPPDCLCHLWAFIESTHPRKPDWYEELFAQALLFCTRSYEAEVAAYKVELFNQLDSNLERILELGIGTGPNLKYYANRQNVKVTGVDPNKHMEKYARDAARNAGLSSSQFEFLHAVAESLPIPDSSVDAVISTLVLCSVKDVSSTLREVKRVLKPGGKFLFVEHVASREGTWLRTWQKLLNPLQGLVADGCHLDRETLKDIESVGFAYLNAQSLNVKTISLLSPHIVGIASN